MGGSVNRPCRSPGDHTNVRHHPRHSGESRNPKMDGSMGGARPCGNPQSTTNPNRKPPRHSQLSGAPA